MNSIVGTAFRVAYALQLQSEGPTLPKHPRASSSQKCSSEFFTQRYSSEGPRCLRGATTAPRQFRCGPLSASRSAEDLIGVADEVDEEVESVRSRQGGRETMASTSWQREASRQTQSEPGEQMVALNQRFEQQSSSDIGEDGSQHSYSVLEPPSLPPSPPPPPVTRPPKSSSSHVIACEVYSDVFEPSPGDPTMEGPWKTLDSSSSPWKSGLDPMEGPAHDSGLSSASASTNSSSGPSELEVKFFLYIFTTVEVVSVINYLQQEIYRQQSHIYVICAYHHFHLDIILIIDTTQQMETLGEDLSTAPWFQATMPR